MMFEGTSQRPDCAFGVTIRRIFSISALGKDLESRTRGGSASAASSLGSGAFGVWSLVVGGVGKAVDDGVGLAGAVAGKEEIGSVWGALLFQTHCEVS